MLPVTQALLTNHNRPNKKLRKLKGIAIHWTGNTDVGANALANRTYFNTTKSYGSAQYVVDDKQIIQCVPDDEVAYHVGANKYTALGQSLREGAYSPNYYLIGIEMCVNRDGNWGMTYCNTVELTAYLLKTYRLAINSLYRHYDITGKDCPRMMINQTAWELFKTDVANMLGYLPAEEKKITKTLKKGSKGEEVRTLQTLLNKNGYQLIVDGDFGFMTEAAAKGYQAACGFTGRDIDGIVGPKTWAKLYER